MIALAASTFSGRMLVRGRNAQLSLAPGAYRATGAPTLTRRRLFESWTIEIESDFEHETEDGSHVLFAPGRTLWCEPLITREPRDVVLARLRARDIPGTLATFEHEHGAAAKFAAFMKGADASGTAWGLLAFTIRDWQYALTGFYFDDPADVAWALRCWKSVRHEFDLQ